MKKKCFLAIFLASVMALAACESSKPEDPRGSFEGEDEKTTPTEKPAEPAVPTVEDDRPTDPAGDTSNGFFAPYFARGDVENNGDYFVRVGDLVWYRELLPENLAAGATFGEFLYTEEEHRSSKLCCYDLNKGFWEEVCDVTGRGELYACPKGIYINAEGIEETDLIDPETGEQTKYCDGMPLGISPSGELLAVERWGGQVAETVLVKDGKDVLALSGENLYYECCGFAGETMIVLVHDESEEHDWRILAVTEDGEQTELGTTGTSESTSWPKVEQFLTKSDGSIALSIAYYEGTGNFLADWKLVEADPRVAGSVEETADLAEFEASHFSGEEAVEAPRIWENGIGAIEYNEYVPGDLHVNEGNLLRVDQTWGGWPVLNGYFGPKEDGHTSILQRGVILRDTAFVIYADVAEDADYDIGWRPGYRMEKLVMNAIPFGEEFLNNDGEPENVHVLFSADGDVWHGTSEELEGKWKLIRYENEGYVGDAIAEGMETFFTVYSDGSATMEEKGYNDAGREELFTTTLRRLDGGRAGMVVWEGTNRFGSISYEVVGVENGELELSATFYYDDGTPAGNETWYKRVD
ncbi:MAG: hypothetical protein K6E50_01900 [Lachnospiraceae bacterium]|nr:hypothetical protein [Lachnospiraceae bacterium]